MTILCLHLERTHIGIKFLRVVDELMTQSFLQRPPGGRLIDDPELSEGSFDMSRTNDDKYNPKRYDIPIRSLHTNLLEFIRLNQNYRKVSLFMSSRYPVRLFEASSPVYTGDVMIN